MVDVKPDEISAILKQQLSGFSSATELEEYGTVLQVGDGIARVYGLTKAQAGELVEFENGTQAIVLNLEEDNVGVVLMGPSDGIREGSRVQRTNRIASLKVGEGFVGRVVNALGQPIDGKGTIKGETYEMPLERKAPGVIYRQPVDEPQPLGIMPVIRRLNARDGTSPDLLLQMATTNGMTALGFNPRDATLAPGAPAKLIRVPFDVDDPADPLSQVLRNGYPVQPVDWQAHI